MHINTRPAGASMNMSQALGALLTLTLFLRSTVCSEGPGVPKAEPKPYSGISCLAVTDDTLADEVWSKVAALSCLKCHKIGGDAEESDFILRDPSRSVGTAQADDMRINRAMLIKIAKTKEGIDSRMLLKVVGKLKHGGKEALKPASAGYLLLADFVKRANSSGDWKPSVALVEDKNAPPFFEGVTMLDDRRLLRRVTLSLAGRLPTNDENETVSKGGVKALPALLDIVMQEDAFYDRLREGFNDIFLTVGVTDNAETVLAYEHFSKTRGWPEKHDLNKITDEKERQKARYKLFDDYRKSILGEPMKLVEYIVRNDRPFTEIVTADYVMVSPYSSRGYGVYEDVQAKFKNPDDPFEYVPVKLKALISRDKHDDMDSATGQFPHAGMLTTFQYLRRYPTTETNRNRLRARMYFLNFLGIDVLELAARVTDAAAVTAKYKVPTMEASECVVCHKTIDPIAGLYQDFWKFEGVYGKRKGGWFTDMFPAGYEGENLPPAERWRALQWLGERTAKDPRFAVAMVEHVYYILTGRKVLQAPKDLDDPMFSAKRRAYQEQRKQTEAIAARFAQNGFNLKSVFKDWIISNFYRIDGFAHVTADARRRAELDDVGLIRMLAPEQIERKVAAVFGQRWGKLNDQLAMLYGGIDSKEVTERAADPSGAMGALQRIFSNDIACKQTALDFSRKPADRHLFPEIEPTVVPGSSPEADAQIKRAIVHLHQVVLGRSETVTSSEVERTFKLFAGIVSDAAKKKFDPRDCYSCRQSADIPDPKYTLRAWRAVVTYLLRQHEFLFE